MRTSYYGLVLAVSLLAGAAAPATRGPVPVPAGPPSAPVPAVGESVTKVAPPQAPASTATAKEADENRDLARRDLAAQESVAASTTEIVLLTRIQMLISIIGALAVVISLEVARRSLKLTRRAIEEQTEATRHQLRAYIGVKGGEVKEDVPGSIEISTGFQNFGDTPAIDVRQWVHHYAVPGFEKTYEVKFDPGVNWEKRGDIMPGGTFSYFYIAEMDTGKRAAARSKMISVLSVAVFTYSDIYGERHVSALSQIFGGPGLSTRVMNLDFGPTYPAVRDLVAQVMAEQDG